MGERWRKIEKGGTNERVIDITYIIIPIHIYTLGLTLPPRSAGGVASSCRCRAGRGGPLGEPQRMEWHLEREDLYKLQMRLKTHFGELEIAFPYVCARSSISPAHSDTHSLTDSHHLPEGDPEGPHIATGAVVLVPQHLGSHPLHERVVHLRRQIIGSDIVDLDVQP